MITKRTLSIRQAIFFVIAMGLLIPALVSSVISLRYSQIALRKNLESQGQIMLDNLVVSLEQPLWDMSFATAERLVDSLMRDTRIVRVTVTDANFGKFVDRFKPERKRATQWQEQKTIVHEGQSIGRVLLVLDDEQLHKDLNAQITGIWVLIIGQLFISLALISWLLQIRLVKPLVQLINDSKRLASGALDLSFNWTRSDELGMLGNSLEFTRQSIEKMVGELEEKNKQLNSDIQARKQVEEALRASEHRFRTLASNAPVGIFRVTATGRCLFINNYWTGRTGISVESVIGSDWTELVVETERSRIFDLWHLHSRDKSAFMTEFLAATVLETPFWVDCKLLPLLDDQGNLTGYIGTLTDISEQKEVETILLKAKESAEAANAAKSEFLSNMSHELRTPMHAILSFSDIGERRVEEVGADKVRQYFSKIRISAHRLLSLLNDLLDLSKLEAGRMTYLRRPSSLAKATLEILDEFQSLALSKKVPLKLLPIDDEPVVLIDQQRMKQVIANIVSNALKFAPEESTIECVLTTNYKIDGKKGLLLSISDQGPGIPLEELELIFDKFIQSSQTKTGAGGTGLGLSISRKIVEDHGGKIWASNQTEPANGAIFYVWLPVTESKDEVIEI